MDSAHGTARVLMAKEGGHTNGTARSAHARTASSKILRALIPQKAERPTLCDLDDRRSLQVNPATGNFCFRSIATFTSQVTKLRAVHRSSRRWHLTQLVPSCRDILRLIPTATYLKGFAETHVGAGTLQGAPAVHGILRWKLPPCHGNYWTVRISLLQDNERQNATTNTSSNANAL